MMTGDHEQINFYATCQGCSQRAKGFRKSKGTSGLGQAWVLVRRVVGV
jgi:hypothetical protein